MKIQNIKERAQFLLPFLGEPLGTCILHDDITIPESCEPLVGNTNCYEQFINNPYVKNIMPNIKVPVTKVLVGEVPMMMCGESIMLDEFPYVKLYKYTGDADIDIPILYDKKTRDIHYAVTPSLMLKRQPLIDKCKGEVLLGGLGLGYTAYMLAIKEDVRSVIVHEKDSRIIDFYIKRILPYISGEIAEKIIIVNGDVNTELSNRVAEATYDCGIIETWCGSTIDPRFIDVEKYLQFTTNDKKYLLVDEGVFLATTLLSTAYGIGTCPGFTVSALDDRSTNKWNGSVEEVVRRVMGKLTYKQRAALRAETVSYRTASLTLNMLER